MHDFTEPLVVEEVPALPLERGQIRVKELHAAGKTTVIREIRPLDDVNEAIHDIETGRVPARIVLQP